MFVFVFCLSFFLILLLLPCIFKYSFLLVQNTPPPAHAKSMLKLHFSDLRNQKLSAFRFHVLYSYILPQRFGICVQIEAAQIHELCYTVQDCEHQTVGRQEGIRRKYALPVSTLLPKHYLWTKTGF